MCPVSVELAVMMGHVAQYFIEDDEWAAALVEIHRSLVPGGWLAFETRNPVIDWIRQRPRHSPMLQEILHAIRENPGQDLQLLPVSVFWGRPLARQKHWIQVLFADTWAVAGRTRRFFTLLFHGRNTRVIFSQPLLLRDLIERIGDDENKLRDHLLTLLSQQREATFGPRIPSRKQIAEAVVADPGVQSLIASHADSSPQNHIRAYGYCREIFADCTQLTIEIMLRLLAVTRGEEPA